MISNEPYRTDLINGAIGAKRITSGRLAEETGLSMPTISAIRNGDPRVKIETLRKVADALNIPMSELFQDAKAA